MNLIIHAPNVHQGGGKTLLHALLSEIGDTQSCALLTDHRFDLGLVPSHIQVFSFAPTLWGRFSAERKLKSLAQPGNIVFCMGNLPPLQRCAGRVVVFLQNRHLLDGFPLDGMPLKTRLRINLERLWLRTRLNSDIELLVQTLSMQNAAMRVLGLRPRVVPFFSKYEQINRLLNQHPSRNLIYPATADKHKNHKNLLAAWELLDLNGIKVELHLTVDGNPEILSLIANLQKRGILIVNHGHLTKIELEALYEGCMALIFPSYMESFGLPLLEAQSLGIPIIASERDYVRDVVVPAETFDPDSAVSIFRAVRRFLSVSEPPMMPLKPSDFLIQLIDGYKD